ncbi:MAG TPA: LemA family protein [Polyangiaceae bacterium]|nr:LemA family protein [Polyangiaceae bacterium]
MRRPNVTKRFSGTLGTPAATHAARTRAPMAALLASGILVAGCGLQEIPQASNAVDAAWGEVQNQYQRRADLVPNLVATVKGYASHERETLDEVTQARAKATAVNVSAADLDPAKIKQFEDAQGALSGALGRLLVVAERYPDLKASDNFKDLQTQLEGTENRISIARRRYIETVQQFNNLITTPPTSFTNSLVYHKQPKPQFSATASGADKAPEVKF